jgi:hypothetical protein
MEIMDDAWTDDHERQQQDNDYEYAHQKAKEAVEWLENTSLIGLYDGKEWSAALKFLLGVK